MDSVVDRYPWWLALRHGGLMIAPGRLVEHFPETIKELPEWVAERLRRAVLRLQDGDDAAVGQLLDVAFNDVVGLDVSGWKKGAAVGPEWTQKSVTGEAIKPRRVWTGSNGARLPVFTADRGTGRLGIGRGRRDASRIVEWLRKSGEKLAVLTNGRQLRLVHAGADYDAWCEWDIDLWFERGGPAAQVDALRILLGANSLVPSADGDRSRLLEAVLASRRGQAEVSAVLGEQVRLAVEHVIRASSESIRAAMAADSRVTHRDLYIAATRMVMRCVVILFAEARELLPRDHAVYESSYGLQALREQLDRMAGGRGRERLRHMHGAWARLLSLFRLVSEGSSHEALPVVRYGGKLFAAGDAASDDPVLRAVAAFEAPNNRPTDADVHRVLELLTRSRFKVKKSGAAAWQTGPVDFSDLSTEYIGILYEGLLDFELRQAPANDPVVFLALGDEPALPFSRLDSMTIDDLKRVVKEFGKSTTKGPPADETEEEEESDEDGGDSDDEQEPEETASSDPADEPAEEDDSTDTRRVVAEAVQIWAERAVREAGIVRYPRRDTDPRVREQYAADVTSAARKLVKQTILPGEFYLVRWGGTRKGSGTFYTKPQLAGPTVRRTLQPLVYDVIRRERDPRTGLDEPVEWTPKTPEEILALKVCDPAMGSGSFLIAALRVLTDALHESLYFHERLLDRADGVICKLADGLPVTHPSQETLPLPRTHEDFDGMLRGRLRRHLVERCLYGVDLDPLAVELGQMALWVETMDPRLPFGFLDHKLKVGNSLVGCWLDRFADYPVMAWKREGGDKNHDRFVHHSHIPEGGGTKRRGDVWTSAIGLRAKAIPDQMANLLRGQAGFWSQLHDPSDVVGWARTVFEEIHSLPIFETVRRGELFDDLSKDPAYRRLKAALDTWCALWFWPGEALDLAPLPLTRAGTEGPGASIAASVAAEMRFFHWEIEFPDVFGHDRAGFDAVVGNPPWEIQKPNSKEFFSNVDPLYRTYGKQEALARQVAYFEAEEQVERDWLQYNAGLKAMSNWVKFAGRPFGDPEEVDGSADRFSMSRSATKNGELHAAWRMKRSRRKGYADKEHPFRHQGSADINTYKLFLELAHSLTKDGGRFGLIVPSGIYTDKGTTELRALLLDQCRWEWLFGFENRETIFDIHRSFKFCPVIVEKGGPTTAIRAAFMQRRLEDWDEAERHVLAYPADRVDRFSPKSRSILEIRSARDLAVLEKMYSNGVLLGDDGPDGWGIKYAREFDMTNDSKLFPPRPKWEARGYAPDEYGHWLKGPWRPVRDFGFDPSRHRLDPQYRHWLINDRPEGLVLSRDGETAVFVDDIDDVALPLYEGRMIGQFDFSEKGWVSGKGRSAVWREIPFDAKVIEPQYLMRASEFAGSASRSGVKVAIMDVTSSTNRRTVISSLVGALPCNHKVPVLSAPDWSIERSASFGVVLNSFVYDAGIRFRLGGNSLILAVLEESCAAVAAEAGSQIGIRLSFPSCSFAPVWSRAGAMSAPWRSLWAVSDAERLRLRCQSDALVGLQLGLDEAEFGSLLAGCDHPLAETTMKGFASRANANGFWRVDKDRHPELRHTVLAQIAYRDLLQTGLEGFLSTNAGDGWMIPKAVRLADYGLGHDDRAKQPQPVAALLGPQFYDWQLSQDVAESWEECRLHAELIDLINPELPAGDAVPVSKSSAHAQPAEKAVQGKLDL